LFQVERDERRKMKISIMALCVCLSVAFQSESFEKRAISAAQRISASTLDAKLPNRSFGVWLNGLVGKDAGIVWQLAECGAGATGGNGQDAPVCAEATALMPNGDTVIIGISVGTFKQGLIGDPAFQGAVIKSGDQLYQVRRLSDLPAILRTPNGVPRALPDLQAGPLQLDALPPVTYPLLASLNPDNVNPAPRFLSLDEDEAPPPAPPARSQQSSGQLMDASVIRSTKPVYPPAARANGVAGKVEVQVVISEAGRVVNATAISGPMILRPAATAAASQWVFNPATRDGMPVRTEKVLTFTFGDK
jgi:TonB family protein